MPDRLIDTNILVYAYDTSEGTKHDIAKEILNRFGKMEEASCVFRT